MQTSQLELLLKDKKNSGEVEGKKSLLLSPGHRAKKGQWRQVLSFICGEELACQDLQGEEGSWTLTTVSHTPQAGSMQMPLERASTNAFFFFTLCRPAEGVGWGGQRGTEQAKHTQ